MKSQTLNLLKKEIKLGNSLQTTIWFVCCFGMYFIPSYPVYIGPFYITLSIMMTFALNQVSHDILYTVLLPVRKIDTVKARFLFCGALEVISFVFAIIVGIIRRSPDYPPNLSGVGITVAYLGLQFILYAIFNLLYLGNVYKNPLKTGKYYLVAAFAYFGFYALFELPVWIYMGVKKNNPDALLTQGMSLAKVGQIFSANDNSFLLQQCIILLIGLIIFALSWKITFNRAARQFEKYDM